MKEYNEWKIFEKSEYDLLKEFDFSGFSKDGYVYILEYGEYVKIGTTKEPYKRIKSLSALCRDYANAKTGRVAISPLHTNRNENEKTLQEFFVDKRIENGELFSVSIESVLKSAEENPLNYVLEEKQGKDANMAKWYIKSFVGSKYNLPKKRTNFPMYSSWEEEFDDKLFIISLKTRAERNILKSEVIKHIKSLHDFERYKEIYENDFDCYEDDVIGMCEYFPELARMADAYLDKLEEVTEKQLNNE